MKHLSSACLLACVALAATLASASAQEPQLLLQSGDWGVYAGQNGARKVCFALAQPGSSQTIPPNRPRDPVFFFVSTRPADSVRNEVSIIMGYKVKAGSEASAEVAGSKFTLQTQADNAWLKDVSEEARLVDAMRKAPEIVIKGVSGRGTQTTDKYSLKGLAQALDRVAQDCR